MNSALPFCGSVFGRAEVEFAAALIVLACVDKSDTWMACTPREIGIAMKKAGDGPLEHLRTNPIMPRPDFRDLVTRGFARFLGDPDTEGCPIEFTDRGFEAMRKFVRIS